MQRERVTDDIIIFISDLYAQVTATAVITSEGVILFDTLLYPDETRQIKNFIEKRLNLPILYVINSHFHADHTMGTSLFEDAQIISHQLCREMLNERGRSSFQQTKSMLDEASNIELVLPQIVFDDCFTLQCGNKTLEIWSSPGHSSDCIVCLIQEDQILLGADTIMPIPYFVDGNFEDFQHSLKKLQSITLETIIQGHGEVVLRGEIEEKLASDLKYLELLGQAVDDALISDDVEMALQNINISSCGKSRTLLNGAVEELHRNNVNALAKERRKKLGNAN